MSQPDSPASSKSLSARFASGIFWSLAGTVVTRGLSFVTGVVSARLLGQVGFGELAMLQSTVSLLGTFAGLGIGLTATKYVGELKEKDPERVGRIIALTHLVAWATGSVMALACLIMAPWLARNVINAPHLVGELRLTSLLLLVSAIFGPQAGILAGCQSFRTIARINCVQGLVTLPLIGTLVWLAGLWGAIIGYIVVISLGGVLSSLALRSEYKRYNIRLRFQKVLEELPVLWQLSLPVFINNTIYAPVFWAANALLANQHNGYTELGLFNVAMQFQFLINGISTMVATVSIPMLVEIKGKDDLRNFARVFNLHLKLNWNLAIALGFILLGLQPLLIKIFGAKFHNANTMFPLVMSFTAIGVACNITGQGFFSCGKMWIGLTTTAFWAFTLLGIGSFLIPLYGGIGLGASLLTAYALALTLQLIILSKIIDKMILQNILSDALATFLLILFSFLLLRYSDVLVYKLLALMIGISLLIKILYNNSSLLKTLLAFTHQSYKAKMGIPYVKNCS